MLSKFQVVFMSVRMFYVVFGRLQYVLVSYVVSNILRLFCLFLVVKNCCAEFHQDLHIV